MVVQKQFPRWVFREAPQPERGELNRDVAFVGATRREEHRDRVIVEPSGYERQDPEARPIQPLSIVRDAQNRPLSAGLGEHGQGCREYGQRIDVLSRRELER